MENHGMPVELPPQTLEYKNVAGKSMRPMMQNI
jgi:hypothetical protein